MKKAFWAVILMTLPATILYSQDLNWNTVTYTTGSLSQSFGTIGSPAVPVSLSITGNTGTINAGFPIKYIASPPSGACAVNCAVRSSINFTNTTESIIYTFSFSQPVSGISFNIYDIDGDDATSGDQATVTASGPGGARTITMTTPESPGATITGSGTTSATGRGTQGNTTDYRLNVFISGFTSSLVITYKNNVNNPTAGGRTFSIGNIDWLGVLPVTWVSFTGQRSGSINILKWVVENETHVNGYEIERSKDGSSFTSIGMLPASIQQSSQKTYTYTDPTPGTGPSFYRIKQMDIDGHYKYSEVIVIRPAGYNTVLSIFPNPASDHIYISPGGNAVIRKLQVFNETGMLVLRKEDTGNRIDITDLPVGVYNVRVENERGELFMGTFLKTR